MGKSFFNATALGLAAALLAASTADGGTTPLETVRVSNQKVLDIYSAHEVPDEQTEREIYEVIDGVTDFDGIAASVTARFCRTLSEEECRQFNEVFVRLLRTSSIKKLGRYRADRFEYLGEEVAGETAVVRTLAYYQDEQITVDYSLAKSGERWVIVNYVVDDIDTIRNYKKQFTRLFAKKSFAQVMERLERKIASYDQQ